MIGGVDLELRLRVVAVVLVCAAAGCEATGEGTAVEIEAVLAASVPAEVSSALRSIAIETSGAATARVVVHGEPSGGGWRVRLRTPSAASGPLTVMVTGRERAGIGLVRGVADLVVAGGRGAATVTLAELLPRPDLGDVDLATPADLEAPVSDLAPPLDLGASPIDLFVPSENDLTTASTDLAGSDLAATSGFAILPMTSTIVLGGSEVFTGGPGAIDWTISGSPPTASIDADGVFRATTTGTWVVVGTSALGIGSDSATITVQSGAIDRVSGPLGGPGDIDGVGTTARFQSPRDVCSDGAGALYVVDDENSVIRKIVVATGQVSTLAGSPRVRGYADGTGSNARFSGPGGIACDGTSALYVADSGNYVIRKVDLATAAVTTIAGSPGSSARVDGTGSAARFGGVSKLALADAGTTKYLYVTDGVRHVRRVDLTTKAVISYAGTTGPAFQDGPVGSATFGRISGLVWDGPWPGALYVSDWSGHMIRTIDLAADTVSRLAGNGLTGATDAIGTNARFRNPSGLTLLDDGVTHALFIADEQNHTLRRLELTAGPSFAGVTTLAGSANTAGFVDGVGSAARFWSPTAVAVANGTLYVADSTNWAVRAMPLATSAVTTFAGTTWLGPAADGTSTTARFESINDVVVSGSTAYVADATTIRQVNLTNGAVTTLAGVAGTPGMMNGTGTAARFTRISGLALGADGALYLTDDSTIRRVELANGDVTTLAGDAGDWVNEAVDGIGAAARFYGPAGLARSGGLLYVVDGASIRTVEIATGTVTTVAGQAKSWTHADGIGRAARFSDPQRIALDGNGSAYVGDMNTLRQIALATMRVTTLVGWQGLVGWVDGVGSAARLTRIECLAWDPGSEALLACDGAMDGGGLRRIRPATAGISTLIGRRWAKGVTLGATPGSLNYPSAMAVSGSSLFVGDAVEGVLLHVH